MAAKALRTDRMHDGKEAREETVVSEDAARDYVNELSSLQRMAAG
jgi:hypothetical protein